MRPHVYLGQLAPFYDFGHEKGSLCVHLLWLKLGGVPLSPDDILQPPGHIINQVLQVHRHEVSTALECTEYVIASSIEVSVS
jgi:hypothetical protein